MRLRRYVARASSRPGVATLAGAALAWAAASWGSRRVGGSTVPGGPVDGTAHLFTTLLVLWALGTSACRRFMVPALVASVAIDVDHIPSRLGAGWLTAGTPRPYTHSLLTIAAVLLVALLWRHRRDVLIGIALGLSIHFWRDLAESDRSGVSLLWPFSYHSFTLPYASYVVAMVLIVGVAAYGVRRSASISDVETPEGAAGASR